MSRNICKAVKTGEVERRGKTSIEWKGEDETPHNYCYGYTDAATEESKIWSNL